MTEMKVFFTGWVAAQRFAAAAVRDSAVCHMHSMAQTVRTASAHEQTRIIVLVDNSARFDTCLIIAKQEGMVQRARMPLADRTIQMTCIAFSTSRA
jgi:hypothetical protein